MAFNPFGKPAGSSLFGQSTAAPQAQGSLFGATPQPANAQQSTGSAFGGFGQPAAQQQPQQNAGTSSLFGAPFGQNNSQQQQTQQQQQPAQTGSLFSGFGGQTQQGQQGNSFFAQPPQGQQQQQTKPSLFGTTGGNAGQTSTWGALGQSTAGGFGNTTGTLGTQPNPPSLFGSTAGQGSLLGQPPQQQTAQQGGAPVLTRSTKFNDLPDDIKKKLEEIDNHIQGRIKIGNDLKQRKVGDEAIKGQEEIRVFKQDLTSAITVLGTDVYQTRELKSKVSQIIQDTRIAIEIIEAHRNGQQHSSKANANFPLEFFTRVTEQMQQRLRWYKTTIEQIERKLSSAAAQPQYTPQAITSTLEAQHATFMALASKAAVLDAELQTLRTLYTQLWRSNTGSMRDPFNELDRGDGAEFGLESLSRSRR